ncbi:MAG: TolB family protein [Candidatus Firestonebacteria bacterium]|nr:TolB family protein [Candidatus Firestonebacteria bacterium]
MLKCSYIYTILLFTLIFFYVTPSFSEEPLMLFNADETGFSNIYTVKLNGTDLKKITNTKDYDFWPRWSKKAGKILFCSMSYTQNGYGNSKILIMDAKGNNRQKLTAGEYDDYFPNWSPDGKKIVFQSYRDGNGEIYIMDSNGKNVKRLTKDNYDDSFPSFTPDGKKILFQSRQSKKIKLMFINTDGTDIQPVLKEEDIESFNSVPNLPPSSRRPARIEGGNNEFSPDMSHDGKKIYFVIDNFNMSPQIYEYDIIKKTTKQISSQVENGNIFMYEYVSVSPDNKILLLTCMSDQESLKKRIPYILNLEDKTRKKVIDVDFNIWFPTWME